MPAPPAEEIDEEHDTLILSVKLKSGRFESALEIPLFATEAEKKAFVEAWFNLMEAGVKCGHEYRTRKAQKVPPLPPPPPPPDDLVDKGGKDDRD